MSSTPIVLVLGAGPRIGAAVASTFASANYKVALASRKGTNATTPQGYFSLKADLSEPSIIPSVFAAVKAEFSAAPSVVVYNAATATPPPDNDSVLSIPVEKFVADLNVNTISAYAAAQEAVLGWETLPKEVKKTFIYTGNIMNVSIVPMPLMFNLGVGKAGSAYWIGAADAFYSGKGYRFFYADERTEEGKLKGLALDGEAHGEFYAQLAKQEGSVPWNATFVKGTGYVQFKQ